MLGWLPGYKWRVPVAINAAQVPGALTDWPFAVTTGFPSGFWDSVAFDDGRDIRCTSGDGETVIPHELVSFDRTAQTMQMHAELPAVASGSPTNSYCYIGNKYASMPSAAAQQATWDSYEAMYHLLEELTGATGADAYADATGNANQGLDYTSATGQSGQIGAGQQFGGGTDRIQLESFQALLRGSWSVSCWVKPDNGQPGSTQVIWGGRAGSGGGVWLTLNPSGTLQANYWAGGASAIALSAAPVFANGQETWHHIVVVGDSTIGGAGGLKVYVDGAEVATGSTAAVTFANYTCAYSIVLGGRLSVTTFAYPYTGYIDEASFAPSAHSGDDIEATFNNQASPSTFYTVSPVETFPLSGAYPRRA